QGRWVSRDLRLTEDLLQECRKELRGWEWRHLDDLLRRTCWPIPAHPRRVWRAAFSADGQKVLSVGGDLAVTGREVRTGRLVSRVSLSRKLDPDGALLVLSPDGKRVAGFGAGGDGVIWDAVTGRALQTLKGHKAWIRCAAFSPDGRRVASGGKDGTLRVWEVA